MSNVAKLKKKAAEFEQKRQFDKALAVYVQVLQASRGTAEEADVALFNRVGDLYMRQGNTNEALTYYERAVDLYADGGYFNNAIALCNKILRQSPGRTVIYYKLGKISAQKGFKSDAKASFLEYAGRMQKVGQLDEAFRALREFADLSPDQEDVRMLLADQLGKNGRKDQALEQLQQLYEKFSAEGRGDEARATQARMQALDANAQPRASATPLRSQAQDLVFLDLDSDGDSDEVPAVSPPGAAAAPGRATPLASTAPKGVDSLPFLNLDEDDEEEEAPVAAPAPAAPAPTAPALDAPSLELPSVEPPRESARTDDRAAVTDAAPPAVEGFERTSLGGPPPTPALAVPDFGVSDFAPPTLSLDDFAQHVEDAAAADDRPLPIPAHDLVLPGELPSVDSLGAPTSAVDGLDMYLPSGFDLDPMAGVQGASGALGIDTDGTLQPTPYQGFEAIPFDLSTAAPASSPAEDVPLPTIELDAFAGTPSAEPEATDDPPAFDPLGGWSDGPLVQPAGATAAESAEDDSVFDLSAFDDPEIDEPLAAPVGGASRVHTAGVAAPAVSVVDALRGRVGTAPGDWELRRRLAEAMFEAGDREGGLRELDAAMAGYERDGDLDGAGGVVDEIVRVQPNSVRHHQKRVEYAVRGGDRPRLADAYVQLADALFRSGQTEMAKAVYQRVLDLVPDDARARAALSAFVDAPSRPPAAAAPAPRPAAAAAPPAPAAPPRSDPAPPPRAAPRPVPPRVAPLATPPVAPPRAAGAPPPATTPRPANPAPALGDGEFVDLGEWLRADEPVKSTRMRIDEQAPTGDEQADFNEMLKKFKAGVAENVDADDHESHYDLGVAFKEMGLLDDAIAEFQKALRAPGRRARTYEALGQCFMEKQQLPVALTILQRALGEPGVGDDQLVGVLYLLGYASEALQRRDDAVAYYQRVFAVDIQFRDVGDRLNALEKVAR